MKKVSISKEQLDLIKKYELEALVEVDRLCKKYNITYTLRAGSLLGAIRHEGFIPWDDDIDICIFRADYEKFRDICQKELNSKFFYQSHETDKEYFHLFDKIRVNGTVFRETFLGKYNIHHGVYIDIFPVDNWSNDRAGMMQYSLFKLYRTVLYSKYLDVNAREGKKKVSAQIIKFIFFPVSNEYLYRKADSLAQKYNNRNTGYAITFGSGYGKKCAFPIKYYNETIDTIFEGHYFSIPKYYDAVLKRIYGNYMKMPPKEKRKTQHDLLEIKL